MAAFCSQLREPLQLWSQSLQKDFLHMLVALAE